MKELKSQIQIYNPDGTALLLVSPNSNSKVVASLMKDDYLVLCFITDTPVRIKRGCYCFAPTTKSRTESKRYIINTETFPQYNTATGGYEYQTRFDAWYINWNRYVFALSPKFGAVQTIFNYTDKIIEHVKLIAAQLAVLQESDNTIIAPKAFVLHFLDRTEIWGYGTTADAQAIVDNVTYPAKFLPDGEEDAIDACVLIDGATSPAVTTLSLIQSIPIDVAQQADPDTNDATYLLDDKVRHVSYENLTIIQALSRMCEESAFNCEWWIDEDGFLHFGRCEYGDAWTLRNGTELSSVQRANASQEYGTRLVAFGSDKNVPSRYRQFVDTVLTHYSEDTSSNTYSQSDTYYKDGAEIIAEYEGQEMTQVFEFKTAEIEIKKKLNIAITLSAEVNDPADYGNAQYMNVEVYFGKKGQGGVLLWSQSQGTQDQGENTAKEISVSNVPVEVEGAYTDRIYLYVTLNGKSAENWVDSNYIYQPNLVLSYSFAVTQILSALMYDANHLVTSQHFFPAYRKAQTFDKRQLRDDVLTLSYASGWQQTVLGNARLYTSLAANVTYTVVYRFALYVDLSEATIDPSVSAPIGAMEIALFNLLSITLPVNQMTKSGLYVIEKTVDIQSTTPITSSVEVRLNYIIPLGVSGIKVYLANSTKGADFYWNISADYFDPVTCEEKTVSGATAITTVQHADYFGRPYGEETPCEVSSTGAITTIGGTDFEVGDHVFLKGLRNEAINLSWFSDRYDDTTLSSYTRRLMLPEDTCPKNYIDSPRIQTEGVTRTPEIVEVVKVFEDIYPTQELVPFAVECYKGYDTIVDDNGQETTVSRHRYAIYLRKTEFNFNARYIPSQQTLQCIFQTGRLSGCQFELQYAGTVLLENEISGIPTGTRFCKFYIVPNNNYGVSLPEQTLRPQGTYYADRYDSAQAPYVATEGGDTIVMINYASDYIAENGFVEAAEKRLETAARAYLDKISLDAAEYTTILANDYAEQQFYNGEGYPALGQKIKLTDNANFLNERDTRVIGLEINLDIPYDNAIVKLGESLRYSKTKDLENQIKQITIKKY